MVKNRLTENTTNHIPNNDDTTKNQSTGQPSKRKFYREVLHILFYLIIVFTFTYVITHFVGQRTQVLGKSMESTLSDQDSLIIDKLTYHFSKPKRFDIIVFPVDNTDDTYYIKRIIGLPGETVQIKEGKIYINNKLLDEKYGNEVIDKDKFGLASVPIKLEKDEYFVLGDNRNHSTDSRDPLVGNVTKESIVGKVWLRIWPFNRFGILKHY